MWAHIEFLRNKRKTGISARLLFEVLGDLWVVDRNPFIYDDLLSSQKRLQSLIDTLNERLDQIKQRANGNQKVLSLHQIAERAVERFAAGFKRTQQKRGTVISCLKKLTRADNILFDGHARVSHVTDATDWRVEYPFVVITPDSEDEVIEIVKACTDKKLGLSIIPRGGGTGYTGSGIPLDRDCAVISTEKLEDLGGIDRRILPGLVSETPCIATGAGVVTERVAKQAQAAGLTFAVDPTSQNASTIGGNIAMNAGGKKAVLWGTTLDNLVSWKMVSPSGTWIEVERLNHNLGKIHDQATVEFRVREWRSQQPDILIEDKVISISGTSFRQEGLGKDVTDKYLTGIPGVQKEGCDGLITSARFILHRLPAITNTVCLEFYGYDLSQSVPAIVQIRDLLAADANCTLSGLEHLDWRYIKAVDYAPKSSRGQIPRMMLLADISSDEQHWLDSATSKVVELAEKCDGEGFIAHSRSAREHFWAARKRTAAIAAHTNAFKINEDVVIPLDRLSDYTRGIEQINIEQSIKNKLTIIQSFIDYFESESDGIEGFINQHQNDIEKTILSNKRANALDQLQAVADRWQHLLKHLEAPAADSVAYIENAPDDKTTLDLFLHNQLRVSLKEEVLYQLDKLFGGQSMLPVREAIRSRHKKLRYQRLFVALHMHAGDGNVHTNIPVNSSDYEMLQEANHLVDRIMVLAKSLGGVISGEHGIGLTKIKYLDPKDLADFVKYKEEIDPNQHFNRGKLMPGSGLHNAYTPSFRLLETEALILENSDLGMLNEAIKDCLRCGKCKPVCATHVPRANLLYSPRNKILGAGLITEAILYEEQTRRGISVRHYAEMNDIADHCTVCHKCAEPCPVNIDFGDVTALLRKILRDKKQRRSSAGAKLAMHYLNTTGPRMNRVMYQLMVNLGYRLQNRGSQLTRSLVPKRLLGKTPGSTTGAVKVGQQLVPFMVNPLPIPKPAKTLRALIECEDGGFIPIIKANPERIDPKAKSVPTVFYFPGCGSEKLFSDIGLATLFLLSESGVQTVLPAGYACCGYPQKANGQPGLAKQINTDNRVLFHRMASSLTHLEIKDVIVSCGTCLDQLLEYRFDRIFPDCRQLDIHEYLMELGVALTDANDTQYIYHDPCHSPIKQYQPLEVAAKLLGQDVLQTDRCCGESGTFSINRPDISQQVRFSKLESINAASKQSRAATKQPDTPIKVLTSCPSCRQGLSRYQPDTGTDVDYVLTELAHQLHGDQWRTLALEHIQSVGVEQVLL